MSLLLALFLLLTQPLPPQAERAAAYIQTHRAEWYARWRDFDICPEEAEAVVYPEIVRYTVITDIVQKALNYSTYIVMGTKGFDFSVGRFQMKPSFVEALEKAWMESALCREYPDIVFDVEDSMEARRARMERMRDESWQCRYLALFLRLFYYTYGPSLEPLDALERLRLAATAYNVGCAWPGEGEGDVDALWKHAYDKTFHFELGSGKYKLGTQEPAPHWCYADLSCNWYLTLLPFA